MTETKDQQGQKQRVRKKLRSNWLFLFFVFIIMVAGYGFYQFSTSHKEPLVTYHNEKIDDTSPRTDRLFDTAPPKVYQLARKIERNEPITPEEVKALPEGALNARYGQEMTLLFHALWSYDLQAIDVLLAAGAAPYMVDHPSTGSGRDFTYYMGTLQPVDRPDLGNDFKTELIKLYLKHGGDPNHRLPGKKAPPFFYYVALMDNLDGVELLLKAGADPLAYDKAGNFNAVIMLAGNRDERSRKIVQYIICRGDFDYTDNSEAVIDIIDTLGPSGPSYPEREVVYKKLMIRILKYHPEFKENYSTNTTFGGPIPWTEIKAMKVSDYCPAE